MDTARAKNISCYNEKKNTTPFLEKMASEGIIFENCYSNSLWTLPSHAAMFTGQYPSEIPKLSKEHNQPFISQTLPEMLSKKGYTTYGISNNGWISSAYGFDRIFHKFVFNGGQDLLFEDEPILREMMRKEEKGEWNTKSSKYFDFLKMVLKEKSPEALLNGLHYFVKHRILNKDVVEEPDYGDDGAEYVVQKVKQLDISQEEPFFLFVNYTEPHYPYLPPKKYAKRFSDKNLEDIKDTLLESPYKNLGKVNEELSRIYENFYDAELNYLDNKIRELHNLLEEKTFSDNIFIIVGDHGEYFGEHKLWEHHGKLEREALHVPMIIHGNEDSKIDKPTELRELTEITESIINDREIKSTKEAAYSEYMGISSHLLKESFPNFDSKQAAKIENNSIEVVENRGESKDEKLNERITSIDKLKK